ncbi:MAG: hypothetical protein QOK40_2032 [Miltoncostaeaceae bacterium]|nr:hypothetical protein [Miltoncostaeaceae bacterium]
MADGRKLVPGLRELLEVLELPDWVAEHPKVHLLPHVRRACARADALLGLEVARVDADGALELVLRWRGRAGDVRAVRAAAFALVGEIAESASYVRQRREPPAADLDEPASGALLTFEVATGMLAPDTSFATHGHTLVLRVLDTGG